MQRERDGFILSFFFCRFLPHICYRAGGERNSLSFWPSIFALPGVTLCDNRQSSFFSPTNHSPDLEKTEKGKNTTTIHLLNLPYELWRALTLSREFLSLSLTYQISFLNSNGLCGQSHIFSIVTLSLSLIPTYIQGTYTRSRRVYEWEAGLSEGLWTNTWTQERTVSSNKKRWE